MSMADVMVHLDPKTYERALARASEQGVSLDDVLRDYLESYAEPAESYQCAVQELLDLSLESEGGSGGRRWTREELHER
jgi:hypothetical protein